MLHTSFVTASQTSQPILSRISLIVQSAFFVFTGLLAFLSYETARRTIFQPLKVEIFKKQLDELSQILRIFSGKNEVDLWDDYHFPELVSANVARMYDSYAFHTFQVTRPEESWEYRHELCPVSCFTVDPETGVVEGIELITRHTNKDWNDDSVPTEDTSTQNNNPNDREERKWTYKNREIHLPRGYVEKEQEFRDLIDNPLCPKSIVILLESYVSNAENNMAIIGEVIRECASEMPQFYPTLEKLKDASYDWITNRIIDRNIKMEPAAKVIIDSVRSYFDSDNLLRQPKSISETVRSKVHRS